MESQNLTKFVSEFLIAACEMRPTPNMAEEHLLWLRLMMENRRRTISLAGSLAEFYINPAIPCYGDVDIMMYWNNVVCLPCKNFEVHRSLNKRALQDVSTFVLICQDKWNCMGYASLHRLNLDGDDHDKSQLIYLKNDTFHVQMANSEIHGPAMQHRIPQQPNKRDIDTLKRENRSMAKENDHVFCIHCPTWPMEAESWITRTRNSGWPDGMTIADIVGQGCDLVPVTHPDCRPNCDQWRFSFSRAEAVLIRSWTPEQQILYHMLRFVLKRDNRLKNENSGVLATYHVKTLMLWSCENTDPQWWISSDLVTLCSKLLIVLDEWLEKKNCPNYFIPECNLFRHKMDAVRFQLTVQRLGELKDVSVLARWFLSNYLMQAISIPSVYNDPLEHYMLAKQSKSLFLIRKIKQYYLWQMNQAIRIKCSNFTYCCVRLTGLCDKYIFKNKNNSEWPEVYRNTFTDTSFIHLITEVAKVDPRLIEYIYVIYVLRVATLIRYRELTSDELRRLAQLEVAIFTKSISRCIRCPRSGNEHDCNLLYLDRALSMMTCLTKSTPATDARILVELSKKSLYEALSRHDGNSDSIHCVVHVSLALLNYSTGHYKAAIEHCCMVTSRDSHSRCELHVELAEVLQIFGDKHTHMCIITCTSALKQLFVHSRIGEQSEFSRHCTWRMFAHYLSRQITSSMSIVEREGATTGGTKNRGIRKQFSEMTEPWDTYHIDNFVDLLVLSACQHLRSFQLSVLNCGFIFMSVPEHYAMFLYNRGQYDEALTVCQQYLTEISSGSQKSLFYGQLVSPFGSALLLLFDEDISYLFGFYCLLHHLSPCVLSRLTFNIGMTFDAPLLVKYLHVQCLMKLNSPADTVRFYVDAIPRKTIPFPINRLLQIFIKSKAQRYCKDHNDIL